MSKGGADAGGAALEKRKGGLEELMRKMRGLRRGIVGSA